MAKGILKFNIDKCKGCGLCIHYCPQKIPGIDVELVNALGYHPVGLLKPDECVACATCAIMCPDGVINVYSEE